ncbi:hypothetical protein RhiirB3_475547 [Rhizophagus irregularis]|nr:hypothetical protein RhiirB3_475547 [Rhizophagus irregularis]
MQKKIAKYLRHIIADVPLEFQVSTFKANLAEETDQDSKKDSQRLTKVMLINDEWDLLHDLISILGPTTEKWIMIQTTLVCGYWILSLDFVIGLIEHRFLDNNTNCKLSG